MTQTRQARDTTSRRQRLIEKLEQDKRMCQAPPEYRVPLPPHVDLARMTQFGNYCIATTRNGLFVTHDPVVRFHRTVTASGRFKDFVHFDCRCWELFGLQSGMQFAVFTETSNDDGDAGVAGWHPSCLLFQNVTRRFDAPAHLHRHGLFTLHNAVPRNREYVCSPDSFTPRGHIRNAKNGVRELSLFAAHPWLLGQWGRINQIDGWQNDLLHVDLKKLQKIPETHEEKAVRPEAGLVESSTRPYDFPGRCTLRVSKADRRLFGPVW